MSYNNLSSLNSASEPSSVSASSNASGLPEKKAFSWTNPSTWSAPSVSGVFKSETCEVKRDKTNEKAKLDYTTCVSKRGAPKAAASSGSFLSLLGLGPKPEAPPAKIGGRKKTQRKKHRKQKKTGKRR